MVFNTAVKNSNGTFNAWCTVHTDYIEQTYTQATQMVNNNFQNSKNVKKYILYIYIRSNRFLTKGYMLKIYKIRRS